MPVPFITSRILRFTKFEKDIEEFDGNLGIGCISDNEAQPLLVKSHLGSFAITTVGRINNLEELQSLCFERGVTHFLEMSTGEVGGSTELIASLINHKATIVEGLQYVQGRSLVKGQYEHIADDTVWYLCGKGIYLEEHQSFLEKRRRASAQPSEAVHF